ncbi:hypothetical protein PIB30_070925 [Stylosanthes scabra]|uniref:Uncharacterized protein n=1 Tax=Stylosanthes scabra TaxID=79078 RepID=A0ABU6ZMF8_9FABA|nr:hypothetical protein [Stylosanthes scabra]
MQGEDIHVATRTSSNITNIASSSGAIVSHSNLLTKDSETECVTEKGRQIRQRNSLLKGLAINLARTFEEVECAYEIRSNVDNSMQIEYPAIFDVAEQTVARGVSPGLLSEP